MMKMRIWNSLSVTQIFFARQIGSFNYDNTKMRYHTYYLPKLPNSTESILDFDVSSLATKAQARKEQTGPNPRLAFLFQVHIQPLLPNERYYLPQETGNYSVAGFRMVMERKISHYVITYYIPSGLFVVVSWASFLIPADDIQVSSQKRYIGSNFRDMKTGPRCGANVRQKF